MTEILFARKDEAEGAVAAAEAAQAATQALIDTVRAPLTDHTTFYVDPAGDDDNGDGTQINPWKTPNFAYNFILNKYDFKGFNAVIQLAAGTYNAEVLSGGNCVILGVNKQIGGGYVIIQGDIATPSNVVFDAAGLANAQCINILALASVVVRGIRFTNSGAQNGFQVGLFYQSGLIDTSWEHCDFGDFPGGAHIQTGSTFTYAFGADYEISGDASYHILVSSGSVYIDALTITLTGTPNFASAFVAPQGNSSFLWNGFGGVVLSGSATGKRFAASTGGKINTFGTNDLTLFPGDAAGTLDENSSYDGTTMIPTAFASLPTGITGLKALVSDSNTAVWGATVAGGGVNTVLAWYNGSNWTVIGK